MRLGRWGRRGVAVPLPPDTLEVDRCYLIETADGPRLCRVVEILPTGQLTYRYRRKSLKSQPRWPIGRTSAATFAAKALREVPCNWRPGADQEQGMR